MRILARYSHLNGEEYLLVHRRKLWDEVQAVIAEVDALACRTKVSRERTMLIDVGIEILPMKELERQMSSGVPYYERDLLNVVRQGRSVPAVPLVLVGVAP